MPTYDYECNQCGHTFEMFQPITAKPLAECPKCGKDVRRLIGSGGGIIFKGSGFYETDYKKKTAPEAKPQQASDKKDGKKDSSSGSESSPAPKDKPASSGEPPKSGGKEPLHC